MADQSKPRDFVEISGTPPLEGKEGFYASYLAWLMGVVNANLKSDSIENAKIIQIDLIEVGIAMLPKRESRTPIYAAIKKEIEEKKADLKPPGGVISAEEERDIVYRAYIREGLGGISTWMDQVTGVVTRNRVARASTRGPGEALAPMRPKEEKKDATPGST